ncbi:calbindin-32-like [Watersipora subatra]|uniref:calbindin-32-like n=1 Tax=Watersipora subatra TaxID=2589382 RepID=UPI00355C0AE6
MASENILKKYRVESGGSNGWVKLSAAQFMEVWNHFDADGNGYIENQELDSFVSELFACMQKGLAFKEVKPPQKQELVAMRQQFLQAFDDDKDNRIDIREMAQVLPTDENFLVLFQLDHPLDSSVDFMKVWKKFDTDCSGFIEANELKNFIKELLKISDHISIVSEDDVIVYADTMLNLFDRNGDGKLQLSEMARLIPVRENFLLRPAFKKGTTITEEDITTVFENYDKNRNGTIENEELHGFVKDLLELAYEEYDSLDLSMLETSLMKVIDINKDGKISKQELCLVLKQLDSVSKK